LIPDWTYFHCPGATLRMGQVVHEKEHASGLTSKSLSHQALVLWRRASEFMERKSPDLC